jgi:hypothetical protein
VTTGTDRGRLSEALRPAVFGGVFFGPAMQVSDVLLFGEAWSWFGVVVRSVFFAVAMGLALAVQYRFSAAGRERAAVSRAVSAGVLPEAADAEWRGPLTAERRRLHSSRTGVPALSALLAVLVAVVTSVPDGPGGGGWLLAVGLALAGGLGGLQQHRRLQTADGLLAELGPLQGPAAGSVRRLIPSVRGMRGTGSFHGGGQGVLPLAWEGRRLGGC